MGGNHCMCLWNRSENKEQRLINFTYFWSKVCYDECGHQDPRKDLSQQICKMYLSKMLIMSTEENNYIFTIGIVPTKRFEVMVRLELENSGDYIEMDTSEVRQLFLLLHQIFHANLKHPSILATPTTTFPFPGNQIKIDVKLLHHNTYKLCVGNKKIFITADGLLKLIENENCIKLLIKGYEVKAKLCGNTVFKLVNLCCQHLQNLQPKKYFASNGSNKNEIAEVIVLQQNNRDMARKINLSEILDELMSSPCDCVSTTFCIETKVHFRELISFWIGAYYETRLLSEAVRIDTFRKKWPHKFIETRTLAKSGFFYVGPFDRVQCVFCKTVLEKWRPTDTVASEHKRYAPFCSISLRAANNIPLEEVMWSREGKEIHKNEDDGAKNNPLLNFINGLM